MAYSAGDRLITIRGNLPGGEVWANTWAVKGTGSNVEAVTKFNTFYTAWAGICANEWTAEGAVVKDLVTEESEEVAWDNLTGDDATNNPLPTECALRVTLNAGGHHGGPFLCGMAVDVMDSNGSVNPTQLVGVLDALDTLANVDLPSDDLALGLNSPTDSIVRPVDRMRIGHIVDVIRRRRNRLSEAYSTLNVA